MKIRNGFVSKSSSSSFMVGLPNLATEKELQEFLIKKMGADENSFFYRAAKEIAECILCSEPIRTKEDLIAEAYADSWEDVDEWYKEPFEKCEAKGLNFYIGSATNDACEIGEQMFCEMKWQVDDDDFFMNKDSGY